ncbi:MAG: hypothetical protein IPK35_02650 [Saprospiraceae bacterium]|jgi:hypothetical protein|nr:hypothetical protein [Saprospiraceae bacterium]
MNIQGFNKILQKIAALTDSVSPESSLSTLERDLLLGYIRELYDIALDDKPARIKPVVKVIQEEVVLPAQAEEKLVHHPQVTVATPVEIQQIATAPKPVIPEVKIPEPAKVHDKIPVVLSPNSEDAAAEIFADERIADLSDKLSLSPIADLTKSMGINERVFTQQELFGNDQSAFNEIMGTLNQFKNFDDAKQYLTDHVMYKYGWTAENKVKKAATFVRHIKRKYI